MITATNPWKLRCPGNVLNFPLTDHRLWSKDCPVKTGTATWVYALVKYVHSTFRPHRLHNKCLLPVTVRTIIYNLKQETIGSHSSPEKPVQIKKHIWLYHYVDMGKTRFISPLKIKWPLFLKHYFPFLQACFVLSKLVKIGLVILEKKILKSCQCIFAIS